LGNERKAMGFVKKSRFYVPAVKSLKMGRRTPPFVSIHQATKEKKEPDENSQRSTLQFCVLLDGARRFEPLKKKKKTLYNRKSQFWYLENKAVDYGGRLWRTRSSLSSIIQLFQHDLTLLTDGKCFFGRCLFLEKRTKQTSNFPNQLLRRHIFCRFFFNFLGAYKNEQ
jgi:hypothetical protein